jgi:hypothetical protein
MLGQVPGWKPLPIVILQPDPSAGCTEVEAIRAEMNDKLDCKAGMCGEGVGWYELPGMPNIG